LSGADIPVWQAALQCRCPRCGRGPLYTGVLTLRDRCPVCGLDLSGADVGDGLAVPLILVLGFLMVGLAVWVEFRFSPPLWVHALLWPTLTIPLAIVLMRPLKAFLVAQQYKYRPETLGL
jgi:uncharacterized protein (DUF983 family)